jgi:hypothetical protein
LAGERQVEIGARLIDAAVAAGVDDPAGRAALAAAERLYARQARRLWRAATLAEGERKAELEEEARRFYARAIAVRRELGTP